MAFVQLMTYSTEHREAMDAAVLQWEDDTVGVRRARRRLLLRDRETPGRYVEVIFFDSYEDAMHNSMLPATTTLSATMAKLTDSGFEFQNLDVLADDS